MKTRLEKHKVCDQCFSINPPSDCICTYSNYKTIELEFEVCECCSHLISDGNPADTDFNTNQYKKHNLS